MDEAFGRELSQNQEWAKQTFGRSAEFYANALQILRFARQQSTSLKIKQTKDSQQPGRHDPSNCESFAFVGFELPCRLSCSAVGLADIME